MKKIVLSTTIAFLAINHLTGCSKSSSSSATGVERNVVNQAYSNLQSAAPDFSSTSVLSVDEVYNMNISPFAAIGSNLTTSSTFPDVANPGSITKKGMEYLEKLYGSSTDNAIFYRAKMPFLIACSIDTLATPGNALYSTSQTSMTLSSAVIGKCGTESDFVGGNNTSLIGTTVTYSVVDLASTTNYDQMITMPGASNSQFGGNDQYIYVRNNSTTLNFMHIELNSGNTNITVNTLSYNKSTQSGIYQYASFSSGGGRYLYRIHMDSSANTARVFTVWKMTSSPAHTILTHVGSTFTSQTLANLSISYTGLGSGGSSSLDNGNACVSLTTTPQSITTDNSLTCGSTTLTAVGAISGHAMITALDTFSGQGSAIRTWASTASSGSAKFPSFDSSTITSASLGL